MLLHCVQGKLAAGLDKLLLNVDPIPRQVDRPVVVDTYCIGEFALYLAAGIAHAALGNFRDEAVHALQTAAVTHDDLFKNLLLRFVKRGQRLLQIDILLLQGAVQFIEPNLIQVVDPRCDRLFLSAFYDLFRIHIAHQLMVSLSFFDRLSVLLTNAPSASCVSLSRLR